MRAAIAASTSPSPTRSDASGARSVTGTPSIRWAVPARRRPTAAVSNATRATAAVSVARESTTIVGIRRTWSAACGGRGRRAANPPKHVLGAARVTVAPQRQRDDVRDAGEIAHEREQRQRVQVPAGAVQQRSIATRSEANREPLEGVQGQPSREVAIERDVAHQGAHGPQRLDVEL